jgi:ZIP family zinc transporter
MTTGGAILYSSLAGAATGIGGLGVYVVRSLSVRLRDVLLSSAAGIMLAASFFSLILPGLEQAGKLGHDRVGAVGIVIAGLFAGALLIWGLHSCAPHEHFVQGRQGPEAKRLQRVWLFVIAITLHNLPEGMAVGVGCAGGTQASGLSLALGIGLQNVPEGLAVAAALMAVGYSRTRSFVISLLTGLVEGIGGALGAVALLAARLAMPWILGVAAGAMLYVISDEVIPETHSNGQQSLATFSLIGGFIVMMFLDATMG